MGYDHPVGIIRHLVRQRWTAALLLVAAALLMRMIVPAGYMVAVQDGRTTIAFCHGVTAPVMAGMSHAGMRHDAPAKKSGTTDDRPCAFASLSAPLAGGADPVLLADAIRFVVERSRQAVSAADPWPEPRYLLPPLRGPPGFA